MKPITGGIDFGTSNSTVAVMSHGEPRLLALEDGQPTLPSAVFFDFENGGVQFGRRAVRSYAENTEGRLLRALKSVLGTSLINEKTRIGSETIAFADIIGSFLLHLKEALDRSAGQAVDQVVLGRPVYFVDGDEAADRRAQLELEKAAQRRGFRHIAFQFEPIAAALDYERRVTREEIALIVDIGGGTSDFSIVRVSPERARAFDRKDDILANTGVHVGGTDLDRLVSVAHVMPELGLGSPTRDGKRDLPVGYFFDLATWQRIPRLYNARAMTDLREIRYEAARPDLVERLIDVVRHRQGHALAAEVEDAKIALTDSADARVRLPLSDERVDVSITRPGFEDAITGAVASITKTIGEALAGAGLSPDRIDTLFLTGGSTAVPILRGRILEQFPNAKAVQGDVFGSVGLGLALDAERKFAA